MKIDCYSSGLKEDFGLVNILVSMSKEKKGQTPPCNGYFYYVLSSHESHFSKKSLKQFCHLSMLIF